MTDSEDENELTDSVDLCLSTYARLLECDETDKAILEIARERIEHSRRKVEDFELRKFKDQVSK